MCHVLLAVVMTHLSDYNLTFSRLNTAMPAWGKVSTQHVEIIEHLVTLTLTMMTIMTK
jgi:hypothetical protein